MLACDESRGKAPWADGDDSLGIVGPVRQGKSTAGAGENASRKAAVMSCSDHRTGDPRT